MSRIAVFDSGIGGTGVLDEVRRRAPWAEIIYLADHAFGPYGERSLEEVRVRTTLIANFLRSAGAEIVVVACNSASAAALHHLREAIPDVLFVGMEPAVKPAAEMTKTGTVAVLATEATFQGELFQDLVGRFGGDTTIIERACAGLALAVERGESVGDMLDQYLPAIADSDADVVVLGCTHYPLIRDEIAARLPDRITLIDPAPAVVTRLLDVARDNDIDLKGTGVVEMWTTALNVDRWDDYPWATVDIPADAVEAISINDSTIVSIEGDITTMPVTAIVNAANPDLVHGGGVAYAIAQAGGDIVTEESVAWVAENGPLEPGVAALTSAGGLPVEYVIHVAGPIHTKGQDNETLLTAAVIGALEAATEIGAQTVAMPAVSAGIYGYPPSEACQVIAESTAAYLSETETMVRAVRLVGYDAAMTERFATAIRSMDVTV
jgi:glutamate racemase